MKPLELMKRLVSLVVPPGQEHIVLDPFAGTGTTALAAKDLGRSYLGIDLVEKYCECARRRLSGCSIPREKKSTVHVPTLFD